MNTLYTLNEQYEAVMNMLYSEDTDIQTVLDTLEGIEGEIEDKADGYAKIISALKADAKIIKEEETRLYDRRKAIENKADMLKSNLEGVMKSTGKTDFKTALYSFKIQKNPTSVVIDDEGKIPNTYLIEQPAKIDKKAIMEVLKDGGCFAFAHLEQGEGLRIR